MFTLRLGSLCNRCLLAQEGTLQMPRTDCDDSQTCRHHDQEKHFHAPRIAQSRKFALCSELANTQQL